MTFHNRKLHLLSLWEKRQKSSPRVNGLWDFSIVQKLQDVFHFARFYSPWKEYKMLVQKCFIFFYFKMAFFLSLTDIVAD